MDLRSGAYTGGGPEDFLFGAVTNQLADFYHVPLSMGAYATGAKRSDWQAGLENGLSAFMASVVGSDMLLGAGLLHGSRIWSYEQMILDTRDRVDRREDDRRASRSTTRRSRSRRSPRSARAATS